MCGLVNRIALGHVFLRSGQAETILEPGKREHPSTAGERSGDFHGHLAGADETIEEFEGLLVLHWLPALGLHGVQELSVGGADQGVVPGFPVVATVRVGQRHPLHLPVQARSLLHLHRSGAVVDLVSQTGPGRLAGVGQRFHMISHGVAPF